MDQPMTDDAPQWLRDAFAAQSRQLAELAAQQAASMATLASRIAQVEERPTNQVPLPTPTSTPDPTEFVRKPKPCLPNPDKFNGKDMVVYPQFEGLLRAKLRIDGASIGGEEE